MSWMWSKKTPSLTLAGPWASQLISVRFRRQWFINDRVECWGYIVYKANFTWLQPWNQYLVITAEQATITDLIWSAVLLPKLLGCFYLNNLLTLLSSWSHCLWLYNGLCMYLKCLWLIRSVLKYHSAYRHYREQLYWESILPNTGPNQYTNEYSVKVFPLHGNCVERASAGLNTAPVTLPPINK